MNVSTQLTDALGNPLQEGDLLHDEQHTTIVRLVIRKEVHDEDWWYLHCVKTNDSWSLSDGMIRAPQLKNYYKMSLIGTKKPSE